MKAEYDIWMGIWGSMPTDAEDLKPFLRNLPRKVTGFLRLRPHEMLRRALKTSRKAAGPYGWSGALFA